MFDNANFQVLYLADVKSIIYDEGGKVIESEELELKEGYAVIQCVYNVDGQKYEGIDTSILDKIHRKKIDISDAIYRWIHW